MAGLHLYTDGWDTIAGPSKAEAVRALVGHVILDYEERLENFWTLEDDQPVMVRDLDRHKDPMTQTAAEWAAQTVNWRENPIVCSTEW